VNVNFIYDYSGVILGTFTGWEGVESDILSLKILDPISLKNLITL